MTVEEIKARMATDGDGDEAIRIAIQRLTELIDNDTEGEDDTPYVERGKLYWRLGDRARCITDYNRAARINPGGLAPGLLKMTYDILDFYHKDLYNP